MKNNKCLYCYEKLNEGESDFHSACSKKLFKSITPPELSYTEQEIYDLGLEVIRSQIAVTGVQPKLSLVIEKNKSSKQPQRFTIVGLWGNYILKPPTTLYPFLPENEDLTMHLAEIAKINTVPHSLIRLKSGSLAYITSRIDRLGKDKIHMEDMCQITGKLTEQKYMGSYEQIGKAIKSYSANTGLDLINYFDILLFSFLTGNADMHLKNFSLIKHKEMGYILSPAYDMVSTALVVKGDTEDFALTLNGKKKKITKKDFITSSETLGINSKAIENIFTKYKTLIPAMLTQINKSFLPSAFKSEYRDLIKERAKKMSILE